MSIMLSPSSLFHAPSPVAQPILLLGAFNRSAVHLGLPPAEGRAEPCVAWCGAAAVVQSGQDLKTWGLSPQGAERYCPQCAARARQQHIALGPVDGHPHHGLFIRKVLPLNDWGQRISSAMANLVAPANKLR
jgi:hypothetical protein